MKKSIPKWKINQNSNQEVIFHFSKKSQAIKQLILSKYQDLDLSEIDKYLLVESYYNKYFYDLELMNQTNV